MRRNQRKEMTQEQKIKAMQMLDFFTNDLISQGMNQEDAFKRALDAINRLIEAAK